MNSAWPACSPISVSISSTIWRTWSGSFVFAGLDMLRTVSDTPADGTPVRIGRPSARRAAAREPGRRNGVVGSALGATKEGAGVLAQCGPVVTTLLEDDEAPSQRGD